MLQSYRTTYTAEEIFAFVAVLVMRAVADVALVETRSWVWHILICSPLSRFPNRRRVYPGVEHKECNQNVKMLRLTTICYPLCCTEQETHGSKMAFLDGPPPTRLCQPMADHMLARGGELRMEQRITEVLLNEDKTVRFPKRQKRAHRLITRTW